MRELQNCCTTITGLALLLPAVLLCTGCRSNQSTQQNSPTVQKIAADKLGHDFETFPNSTGEYILCVQRTIPDNTVVSTKFLVIRTAGTKIMLAQSYFPGYVKWFTESSLGVLSAPGILKEHEDLSDYVKIIVIRIAEK